LPKLFNLVDIDAFTLPYTFFNGLLKPKDAVTKRLYELLLEND